MGQLLAVLGSLVTETVTRFGRVFKFPGSWHNLLLSFQLSSLAFYFSTEGGEVVEVQPLI